MKPFLFLLLCCSIICTTTIGQDTTDVIIKHTGERLKVKILSVDEVITFIYPEESVTNKISKNTVDQIIFSNGRIQKCSHKNMVKGEDDWEKVIITNNPDDVRDLVRKGEVRSTANNTWSFKGKMSLDKKATRKIKKKLLH